MSLHPEELARIVRVLRVVRSDQDNWFDGYEWFMAGCILDRANEDGRNLALSEKERTLIARLEAKVKELGR
ncbi:MAG: hypothetical protein ACLFV8_14045 [Alphaproteobacteria bacterium]